MNWLRLSLPCPAARVILLGTIELLLTAAASAQPGPGFALRFDGSGNYVAVPHTDGLNAYPLTVTAWVKTTQTTGQQGLVNKYVANSLNGWNVFLLDGRVRAWYFADNTRFVWDGSNGLDGGFIADGAWHHIAFTVDASGGKLSVDGVLRVSRFWTGTPGPATTAQEVRFGRRQSCRCAFMSGQCCRRLRCRGASRTGSTLLTGSARACARAAAVSSIRSGLR